MSRNWTTTVDNARKLANRARKSEHPKEQVHALVRCIVNLCAAIEDVALKAGLSREDAKEDATRD